MEHLDRLASPQGHGLRVVASIVDVLERSDAFLGDDVAESQKSGNFKNES